MLKDDILRFLVMVASKAFADQSEGTVKTPEISFVDEVKDAHRDWMEAQKRFEWVTDPDLVDQAIYAETAAQKKYQYLLKKAREAGNITQGI